MGRLDSRIQTPIDDDGSDETVWDWVLCFAGGGVIGTIVFLIKPLL